MIYESGIISGTDTDVLNGGRLNTIPYGGKLTLDFQAQYCDATNLFQVTIQLPNGDVPVEDEIVPGTNPALAGILDERQLMRLTFAATQGGHFNIKVTETGTNVVTYRAVLTP